MFTLDTAALVFRLCCCVQITGLPFHPIYCRLLQCVLEDGSCPFPGSCFFILVAENYPFQWPKCIQPLTFVKSYLPLEYLDQLVNSLIATLENGHCLSLLRPWELFWAMHFRFSPSYLGLVGCMRTAGLSWADLSAMVQGSQNATSLHEYAGS